MYNHKTFGIVMSQIKLNKQDGLVTVVKGHCKIEDDLGNVLLDKDNAVHPQNMSRIIARALANESNSWIHRLAFGNGGTAVNATYQVSYNAPRDGINDNLGYASRLYNETYSEYVLSSSNLADGNTTYSREKGVVSQVIITATLAADQPGGQPLTDNLSPTEYTDNLFTFDEIGCYTSGLSPTAYNGYQDVNVGIKLANDTTGLAPNTAYSFWATVDGSLIELVITTPTKPLPSDPITFQEVIDKLNMLSRIRATMSGDTFGNNTYGRLRITSTFSPAGSGGGVDIESHENTALSDGNTHLFTNIVGHTGYEDLVVGSSAGIPDNVAAPETEVERLLTHLIFSPITKAANRVLKVTYTLTIQVAPTA